MVDTPKFSKSSVDAVLEATNGKSPDYLFLSHVDDTADHLKWVTHFPNLKRIFHSEELKNNWLGDTTLADVEILLPKGDVLQLNNDIGLIAYSLDGRIVSYSDWKTSKDTSDVIIFHTPGHSLGSISLLYKPSNGAGVLFTGDTYAYTTSNGG
jgi:glyoxylase-like metal-dependent hydrolase (beta-lactamase superfamily II)